MSSLANKTCVPSRGDVPALKGRDLNSLHREVSQWKVVTEHHITRTFTFPDFRNALDFVNRVGEVAEQQGHHPDILLAWGNETCVDARSLPAVYGPRATLLLLGVPNEEPIRCELNLKR